MADRYLNAHSSKYMFKAGEIQKAHDTMLLFSKDMDEEKFNVHEMAQMWFEWHCGRAYLAKGDHMKSLKQLSYIVGHHTNMAVDITDFFWCSMKRVTLLTYVEGHEYREKVLKGKWPVKGCIALLKLLARIRRDVDVESETAKVQEEYEAHK